MGHHVSKSKKRSFGNLTSESQQTSTPKQKTSSKLTKESKTATSTKGGASSKKSSQKGKMPLLRWQSGQSPGFALTTLVVIGTDCIDSYKSNYHMITTTMAPYYFSATCTCNECYTIIVYLKYLSLISFL
jgi:hypothetical protein